MQAQKSRSKEPTVSARKPVQTTHPRRDAPAIERLAVTIEEAQQMLGVQRTKVYALLGEGKLTAHKIGRRTVVSVASIRSFVATLPTAQIAEQKRAA
jgi:excisionase family DNA binding protein